MSQIKYTSRILAFAQFLGPCCLSACTDADADPQESGESYGSSGTTEGSSSSTTTLTSSDAGSSDGGSTSAGGNTENGGSGEDSSSTTGPSETSESGDELPDEGLAVDCSDRDAAMMPICRRPNSTHVEPGSFGMGITLASQPGLKANYGGGVLVEGELIVGVRYGNDGARQGYVSAVDLESGDRRVLSGTYVDPRNGPITIGDGPEVGYINDMAYLGGDSVYALVSPTSQDEFYLMQIDLMSGDRTVRWGGNDDAYGQCSISGTVNRVRIPTPWSMAIVSEDEFYLGFSNNPSSSGVGIGRVRLDKNGSSCEVVSLSGHGLDDRGAGVQFTGGQLRGLSLHDGYIYAVNDQAQVLFRVDPSSGDRQTISSASVGTGPMMGVRTIRPQPGLWWTGGGFASSLGGAVTVDPDPQTGGDRVWYPFEHGPAGYQSESELWVLADGLLLTVVDGNGLARVDPATGNSNLLSY